MPTQERDGLFEVTLNTEHLKSYRIRAAYLNVDERYFPGCIQLKTENGGLAALVPANQVLIIQRVEDPAAPKPAPMPHGGGSGGPSPATVAAATRVWSAPATTGGTP